MNNNMDLSYPLNPFSSMAFDKASRVVAADNGLPALARTEKRAIVEG